MWLCLEQECEFKCTTVNGMKYHYVRCMKTNPPEFKCEVCNKKFQCRTGLVWHLKKTHNVSVGNKIGWASQREAGVWLQVGAL